jgi:peptide/nickel transport system substrate-binding protein
VKLFLTFVLVASMCAGCTRSPDPAGGTSHDTAVRHPYTIPHVLRYAGAEDITGLNPHLASQQVVAYMSSMTMAWLIKTGPDTRPIPELATVVPTLANGGIARDGKTITYHLRRDAVWSDGVPFTADDVVFSIKTVLNPATNEIGRDGWDLITKVDEPDKYTVAIHLKKPYSPYAVTFFSSADANPCVLPKHLLADLPNINHAAYNALPVGIGPFKYASWKRGDSVEMVANPRYFRGMPKLNRIVFKIVPDRNTVLTQLTTHELDLWTPISPPFYGRVKAIDGITASVQPGYTFDHLDFNVQHPVVADPVVRQALRFAMDRDQIRVKIRHGLGLLSESVYGPNQPAYHPIALVPFDLARANALLDGAGWRRGADGIRVKNGMRLSLDLAMPSGIPDTDSEVELFRENWKKIGVEATVHHYLSSLMFAAVQDGGIIYGGKFDMTLFAWTVDPLGDLYQLYGCGRIPPNGQNDPRWCDARADAAMSAFNVEYDEKKRGAYSALAMNEIVKEVPIIVIDIRPQIYAYNSDLKNWHPNPVAPFDDMMNVDI